jgi:phosphatidyl-myo-inositol dimannoside synthase
VTTPCAAPRVDGDLAGEMLLVTELFPPFAGGSAVLLHEIYSRLADVGVTVLTDPRPSASGSGFEPDEGLTVRHAEVGCSQWGWLNARGRGHSLQLAGRLREKGGVGRVVHCARPLPEGAAACLARLRGGCPYAVWTHGEDLGMACTSRELTLIVRLVYRCCAAAFANSHNTARLLRSFSVPDDRVHVVYPGVDSSRFHPDVDGRAVRARLAAPDETLVLSVGRLQRRKGHDIAIEAIGQIAQTRRDIRYVVVGTGEELERLLAIARASGVADRVTFVGEVAADQLPAYYAASDMFLLPNRDIGHDFEGFGIVFLEAAASGRPSIGGASGGVPEAIEDEGTGLLVDGCDARAVAAAITRLADAPLLRQRLGAAGRARAAERFTWDRAAAEVRRVQEDILRRTRTSTLRPTWSQADTGFPRTGMASGVRR